MKEIETLYIGSNFSSHDSAIFIIIPDKKEIFAIETERITRYKHDKLFAIPALEKFIKYKKINASKIQKIYFANTFTTRKNEKCHPLEYELALAERKHWNTTYTNDLDAKRRKFTNRPIKKALDLLKTRSGRFILIQRTLERLGMVKKIFIEEAIKKHLNKLFPNSEIIIEYYDHQYCHAISSYFTSPFEKTLLFSYDGWGDGLFSRIYTAENGELNQIAESKCERIIVSKNEYPFEILASPAGIYAYFTGLLGYKPTSEEGKVEALAAYGKYDNEIYKDLMTLFSVDKENKALVLNSNNTEFLQKNLIKFRIEKYKKEDIAAAVQKFLENVTHEYILYIKQITNADSICLSGGASANVIMNLDIFEKIIPSIHITPAMADDGTSQGAVILSLLSHGYSYKDISYLKGEAMPYYGTSYSKKDVYEAAKILNNKNNNSIKLEDWGNAWPEKTAELLCEGKVGAIFHGYMEWGPRALGNRSIIALPSRADFREKINKTIKRRPVFQPFCPSILEEEALRLFEKVYLNRHMTTAFRMKKEFWDKLPSAIHIDGTARAQFVNEKLNPNYYRLLKKVKEITSFGVIINTSFNKHGRTIVESPTDAITDFLDTDMDYVIIEGIKITRT